VTDFTVGEVGAGGDRDVAGLIGNEILSRFKVIFDYSRQEMILEPNAHLSDPFGVNVSGLELELKTKPRRVIRVADVKEESAAAGAGIRTGDQLIAIDNRSTSSLSVEEIDKLLQQEEREFLLTIKRGPGVLKIKLKTKKRI
jgi:C-terminal processing protease CtpA/Prc